MKKNNTYPEHQQDNIPDIDIIDLDNAEDLDSDKISDTDTLHAEGKDTDAEDTTDADSANGDAFSSDAENETSVPVKKHFFSRINMHIVFLAVVVVFFVGIIYKFSNWGVRIDLEEIFRDGEGTYEDTLDEILPLIGGTEEGPVDDGVTTILAFGNAPFADDRDSEDNLANIIAKMADATVYNCSVSGSYLAALNPYYDPSVAPMDAYNFYWLCTLATGGPIEHYYDQAKENLGENTPAEADEVYNTLTTLDYSTVDVITIMYDASDYLAGHAMYSDQNSTDIEQFTGNLEAGIELLQNTYPNIRIIVMSPTYAFAVDENGEYISSDMYTYGGRDVLSTYVIKEYASCASRSVSFVDHLYGTINEDNAKDYLIDNLHLNLDGRKKVAERFEAALNYYNRD